MRAALAGLGVLAALPALAVAAAPPGAVGPEGLACPETLADFARQDRDGAVCRYRSAGAEGELRLEPLNLTPGQSAAPETGAALVSSPLPGWERQRTHLGETSAGDRRREVWTAAAAPRLSITVEYAIPAVSPAQVQAFVTQAGAANGAAASAEDEKADGEAGCADDLAGLPLDYAVGAREGGAAVLSGCAYAGEDMSVLVYTPRAAELALDAFLAGAPPGAQATDGPTTDGAQAHVFRAEDASAGLWLAQSADGPMAVEIVWTGADAESRLTAVLTAAFR